VQDKAARIAVNGRTVAEFMTGELLQAYEHALEHALHLEGM
jgi:hypothetical protein